MVFYKDFAPLVSIILPTFNRRKLIERAINSVLKQSLDKWELIIIDDGSTDGTQDFVNRLAVTEKRIKYLRQSHRGISYSLNTGIKTSKGRFITFLGSDDEYKPEHLQLRADFFHAHPGIDLIHGGIEIVGDPFVPDKRDTSKKIHIKECIVGGTFFGKRKVFENLNGFKNIPYSEDSEFLERASKIFNIRKVDFPTYVYYRNTRDSITNTI